MSSREIITVMSGGLGFELGQDLFNELAREHTLDPLGSRVSGGVLEPLDNVTVFFNETRYGNFLPRTISCDLSLEHHTEPSRGIFQANAHVSNRNFSINSGSGNCYANAFHTSGPPVAQKVLEGFRKEVEKCDLLQGVQFLFGTGGGTGSGLGGLIMKSVHDYLDRGTKSILYAGCLAPSPRTSDNVLEIYNSVLSFQDMTEHCHLVLPFDKLRASRIGDISKCLVGLTSSLRFPGILNADLRKIHSYVVPFKNAHFLLSSFGSAQPRDSTPILDLVHRALDRDAMLLSVDPGESRALATMLAFRGQISASKVDEITIMLQKAGSAFDKYYPDWIPNSISASISGGPETCVSAFANNSCIHQFFDRIVSAFDKQLRAKSHLYLYEENGIHADEMNEARHVVAHVSDQYKECAQWDDKIILKDPSRKTAVINSNSSLTKDQLAIASEILTLTDCVTEVK